MLVSSVSLTDQALKEAFVEGKLAIDCLDITLTRNGPGEPSSFSCPGFLLASPELGIEGRFVIARKAHQPFDMAASMREQMELQSGKLISPSRYFSLEAKDIAGNIWKNPSASVDIEHRKDAFIVKVSCEWLRCESSIEGTTSSTHMIFMDELRFPENVVHSQNALEKGKKQLKLSSNASAGEAAGMLVTYDPRVDRPGAKYGELFATSQLGAAALPENFDDRLVEAMRFCTASVAQPVMRETVHSGKRVRELARHRPVNKGMLGAPLLPTGNDADFYRLLERYFLYAAANAAGRDFAPLSAKVGGLFTLKGVNLDTVALLVSVAVESVLNEDPFEKLGEPPATVLGELKQMIAHIKASKSEPNFIKRVCGILGGIKSSRTKDKLHALVVAAAIDEADRKAWNDTRNKVAHGSFEIDPAKFQELIDVVFRLSALVYKIVFLQIGYKGKFTDYGARGWPLRDFTTDLAAVLPGASAPAPAPAPLPAAGCAASTVQSEQATTPMPPPSEAPAKGGEG